MIIACPHCAGLNRVPQSRLQQQPSCGKCKKSLFVGTPIDLTAENFVNHAVKSDLPILLDFWASWCGPCQNFAPTFAAAANELEPQLRFGKINTETEQQLAAQFQIRSIPTLVLMQKGQVLAQLSGALPKAQLYQWLEQQQHKVRQTTDN